MGRGRGENIRKEKKKVKLIKIIVITVLSMILSGALVGAGLVLLFQYLGWR